METKENILTRFLADKHPEGILIEHAYFWQLFDIEQPVATTRYSVAQSAQWQYLGCMEYLIKALLHQHGIDMQSVRSQGYRVVPFKERIPTSIKDMKKGMSKEVNKSMARLTNIPGVENLSYIEQRQRDYTMQMLSAIKRDLRAMPRYPKD